MALYLRDGEVDNLVTEFMTVARVKTKTDAVVLALKGGIEARSKKKNLKQLTAEYQTLMASIGSRSSDYNLNELLTELYEDK